MGVKKSRRLFSDTVKRSAAKSFTFRIIVICTDAIITYALTHRYDIVIGFVVFTNLASTVAYFIHERLWSRIPWGKRKTTF